MIEVITIRIITDEVIPDQITDKMPNGLLGTEVRVETEMKTILEVEVETKLIVGLSQGEERSLPSRSNSRVSTNHDQVRCYRCWKYNHFTSKCPNTPTDEETDYEDVDPASLQMMTQNYGPVDSEGEVDYLNF